MQTETFLADLCWTGQDNQPMRGSLATCPANKRTGRGTLTQARVWCRHIIQSGVLYSDWAVSCPGQGRWQWWQSPARLTSPASPASHPPRAVKLMVTPDASLPWLGERATQEILETNHHWVLCDLRSPFPGASSPTDTGSPGFYVSITHLAALCQSVAKSRNNAPCWNCDDAF